MPSRRRRSAAVQQRATRQHLRRRRCITGAASICFCAVPLWAGRQRAARTSTCSSHHHVNHILQVVPDEVPRAGHGQIVGAVSHVPIGTTTAEAEAAGSEGARRDDTTAVGVGAAAATARRWCGGLVGAGCRVERILVAVTGGQPGQRAGACAHGVCQGKCAACNEPTIVCDNSWAGPSCKARTKQLGQKYYAAGFVFCLLVQTPTPAGCTSCVMCGMHTRSLALLGLRSAETAPPLLLQLLPGPTPASEANQVHGSWLW